MLFNSFTFLLVFLPLVVVLTIVARALLGPRAAQLLVLAASVVFYSWFKPANLWYLGASILINFLLAQRITKLEQPGRKRLLVLGLILNVAYLCVFKYLNFLFGSILFLGHGKLRLPDLAFPLGISFFTLSQIMYLVDCYEGLLPALSLFDHATFVAFFPYIISGPIAKAKRMAHQFGNFGGEAGTRSALISRGLFLFTIGLFKKVVFADAFATIANIGFNTGSRFSAAEAWIFSISYTLQLYFDFSGYSDMAIGAGMMLGGRDPDQLRRPAALKVNHRILAAMAHYAHKFHNDIPLHAYIEILLARHPRCCFVFDIHSHGDRRIVAWTVVDVRRLRHSARRGSDTQSILEEKENTEAACVRLLADDIYVGQSCLYLYSVRDNARSNKDGTVVAESKPSASYRYSPIGPRFVYRQVICRSCAREHTRLLR
jgi:hypothetical protein